MSSPRDPKTADELRDIDSRHRHPSDYPDCPTCGIEIFVDLSQTAEFDFVCWNCGGFFND